MKKIIIFTLFTLSFNLYAQVGIGTETPTETLDVNGTFKIHEGGRLYLENPGYYNDSDGVSIMMVKDKTDNNLKSFNPETAPFAAVTYTSYFFDNVDEKGLVEYDTKIDGNKYYLNVGGFLVHKHDGGTSISLTGSTGSNGTINYLPLYNSRAFVKNGTWHLTFQPNSGRTFESNIDITLNVTIYYNNFLTSVNEPIVYNMNANTAGTGSTPAPQNINQ